MHSFTPPSFTQARIAVFFPLLLRPYLRARARELAERRRLPLRPSAFERADHLSVPLRMRRTVPHPSSAVSRSVDSTVSNLHSLTHSPLNTFVSLWSLLSGLTPDSGASGAGMYRYDALQAISTGYFSLEFRNAFRPIGPDSVSRALPCFPARRLKHP